MTQQPEDSQPPALLRLPNELRREILLDVLSVGVNSFVPSYADPIEGFYLGSDASHIWRRDGSFDTKKYGKCWAALLRVNRALHDETLQVLAENFTFGNLVNLRDDAPPRANTFRELHALNPTFRNQIRSVAIMVDFRGSRNIFNFGAFWYDLDPGRSPMLFEQIIENVTEIVAHLPACQKFHLIWGQFFGNGAIFGVLDRYSNQVMTRLVKEMGPYRNVTFSAQHLHMVQSDGKATTHEKGAIVALSAQHYYVIEDGSRTEYVSSAKMKTRHRPCCSVPDANKDLKNSCDCSKCDLSSF